MRLSVHKNHLTLKYVAFVLYVVYAVCIFAVYEYMNISSEYVKDGIGSEQKEQDNMQKTYTSPDFIFDCIYGYLIFLLVF